MSDFCNLMDYGTPGFPIHHQLPELAPTHVHQVGNVIHPSHPLSSPSPPAFNLSQHHGLFQWVDSSHQVAKVLELQLQHQPFFFQCESESHLVMSDSLQPHGLSSPWNSSGQNIGVSSLSLLQGIFPPQGSNLGLLHHRQILYQLRHKQSPRILEWVAYPFSADFPDPGVKLVSPALQVDSFPTELSGKSLLPLWVSLINSASCMFFIAIF